VTLQIVSRLRVKAPDEPANAPSSLDAGPANQFSQRLEVLRLAATSSYRTPAQGLGLFVGQIKLAYTLARVREGNSNRRAFAVRNLLAAPV
jgi:hypothetical protein